VPAPPRKRPGRKLLVASIGIATINYVACSSTGVGPSYPNDAAADGAKDGSSDSPGADGENLDGPFTPDFVANLVAPPDAGSG
jgi:hypothetical protein